MPPDVHSVMVENGNESATIVHVSWNGATEVESWILYKSNRNGGSAEMIASSPRRGFETPLTYRGHAQYVFAEAIDREGTSLGTSLVATTITTPDELHPAVVQQIQWLQDHPETVISSNAALGSVAWEPEGPSVFSNPYTAFLSGVLFCLTIGLLLWASARIWFESSYCCMPDRPSYEALPTSDHE